MASKIVCAGCRTVIKDVNFFKLHLCKQPFDVFCANIPKEYLNTRQHICKCPMSVKPKVDNQNTPVRDELNKNVTMLRKARMQHICPPEERPEESTFYMDMSCVESNSVLDETLPTGTVLSEAHVLVAEMRLFREEMRAMRLQLQQPAQSFFREKASHKTPRPGPMRPGGPSA
ncbi:hypothetical protein ACJJTC_013746 [Scirpophaga incertulas]